MGTTDVRTIPFGKPILGDAEKQAVLAVMDSGMLVHGSRITEFEAGFAAFTGAHRAVGVSSCTAGMHLAYFDRGIGAGDEVIVPAMTHTATAHAVELAGAKAVFVDVELRTGNIDIDRIEDAITGKTKAIAVVHYLGMPVDMPAVMEIARRHGLFVVEDCALAVGSRIDETHAGLFGDLGCFSFYPVKHMTTAEGGMVITKDDGIGDALTLKRAFGVDRHHGQRNVPGVYDVVELGYNYRMSEIHAAIGMEQLKRLPQFLDTRRVNAAALRHELNGIVGITQLADGDEDFAHSYYCHSIVLDDRLAPRRSDIMAALKSRGVGTSIYYPHAVPAMSYYSNKYGYGENDFPNASRIANQSIALPVGPHLNEDDMRYIAASVAESIGEVS